jgi:hypothetical protein
VAGKHNFLSLLLGWWGLPWGPIYTLEMLQINSNKQGGAADVTEDVLLKPHEKYGLDKIADISNTDISIEYNTGWGTSNNNPKEHR